MGEELQETHSQILAKNCDVPGYADPLYLKTSATFAVYIVGCIWILLGLRVVSERYFARSIEGIIAVYKIPPNIAGATLMAAGTSAPELISSLVGVFLSSKVETGAGTVIGSVIFNQLMIVGLCIIVSPNGRLICSPIDMARDMVYYAISIGIFVWFFFDEQVTLGEAWGFVGAYILYVVICGNWTFLDKKLRWALGHPLAHPGDSEDPNQAHNHNGYHARPETPKKPGSNQVAPSPQFAGAAGDRPSLLMPSPMIPSPSAHHVNEPAPDTSIGFLVPSANNGALAATPSPPDQTFASSVIPIEPVQACAASASELETATPPPRAAASHGGPIQGHGTAREAWVAVEITPSASEAQGSDSAQTTTAQLETFEGRGSASGPRASGSEEEGSRGARGGPHLLTSADRSDSFFNRVSSLGSMKIPPLIKEGTRASLGLQVYGPAGGFGGLLLRVGSSGEMATGAVTDPLTTQPAASESSEDLLQGREGDVEKGGEGGMRLDGSMVGGAPVEHEGAPAGGAGGDQGHGHGHGHHDGAEEEELSPLQDYYIACEGGLLSRVFFLLESFWVVAVWLTAGWFRTHKWYLSSFCICLLWFTIHCIYLIFWLEKAGCVISLSPGVMGVVFGAAGTSIPDCLCSLFVARKGLGSMALTNVWGSNVFDLLFALGVPWVCSLHVHGGVIKVQGSNSLSIWMGALLIFFVLVSMACQFHYKRWHGYMFVGLYAAFIAYNFANDSLHFAA